MNPSRPSRCCAVQRAGVSSGCGTVLSARARSPARSSSRSIRCSAWRPMADPARAVPPRRTQVDPLEALESLAASAMWAADVVHQQVDGLTPDDPQFDTKLARLEQ